MDSSSEARKESRSAGVALSSRTGAAKGPTCPVRRAVSDWRYWREQAATDRVSRDEASQFAINPTQPHSLLRFSLLRQLQSVFYLDAEVTNRAFELCVPKRSCTARRLFVRR
jgi:hypothetical protein